MSDEGKLVPIDELVPGDMFRKGAGSWSKNVFIGKTVGKYDKVHYVYCGYWNGAPSGYSWSMPKPRNRVRHIGSIDPVNIQEAKSKYNLISGETFVKETKKAPKSKEEIAESAKVMGMLPGAG